MITNSTFHSNEKSGFPDLPGSGDGEDSAEAIPADRLSRVPPQDALLIRICEGSLSQNHNAGGPQSARLSAQPRLLKRGIRRAQEAGKEGHCGETISVT